MQKFHFERKFEILKVSIFILNVLKEDFFLQAFFQSEIHVRKQVSNDKKELK